MYRIYISLLVAFLISSCTSTSSSENVDLKSRLDRVYQNNEYKEAISILNQLIPLDSLNGELYYKRGISYSQVFKDSLASADFKKSIDLEHRLPDSYFNLAVLEINNPNDSLLISYLKKSLTYDPNFEKAKEMLKKFEKQ